MSCKGLVARYEAVYRQYLRLLYCIHWEEAV
jgi:hypothetical protein